MVQLAGQHGDVAARSMRAEDMAQQIADTNLAQARLQKEHARLLELQQRRDLAVTDLLAVSRRLAEIEAEAQQTQQQAAQQQRRVRTQLLTLNSAVPVGSRAGARSQKPPPSSARYFPAAWRSSSAP